ncbi:tRNA(Met) cytidine acetyltransferase TmcA [Marichromatium sp. AB31]|uniref:tRNA(Met) cytidine acetyltransferase TmcA n=1 Tax=Marichromatium sp. AB31 TaxID=2483362 RepID=UPI000F3E64EC|nr:GNAT family N-acetyltransferase [Marichromatium sp. AB31]RNE90961.1 tRNA(Met) cytidine acetyltransferase [Marichromatium sp. AB31]
MPTPAPSPQATAIVALARALRAEALGCRQRRVLLVSGEVGWCERQALAVLAALPGVATTWLSARTSPPQAEPLGAARKLLGGELALLVYDAHGGFDPDAFGAATGALIGGGLLLLLTPPLAEWSTLTDPQTARLAPWPHPPQPGGRFIARLARVLVSDPALVHIDQSQPPAHWPQPAPRAPAPAPPPAPDAEGAASADQARAIAAVLRVARGRAHRPLVLSAHRGRGKSAALGIAARRLLAEAEDYRILVTAPNRGAAATLLGHAGSHPGLDFVAPADLLDRHPAADLVLVDEAAAIPAPLLEGLLHRYPRLVFAATVHGYEGTGRGFELRFRDALERHTPGWRLERLEQPIRWAAHDPLEALGFRALLLDAAIPAIDPPSSTTLAGITCERLDRDTLAGDETTLGALFGLLVQAHYQTRPADLRMLLDGPGVRVYACRLAGRVVATLIASAEGGIDDPALRAAIFEGRRRPRGHLLPQTLSAHAGLAEAPALRALRVVRIATHPALRRHGLGARLLTTLQAAARAEGLDLVGTSFGATPGLLAFWRHQGWRLAQVGTSRNAASGEHAVVLLAACSAAGKRLATRAERRLGARIGILLAGPLRALDPRIAAALLSALPPPSRDALEEDSAELHAFANAHRTLEASLAPLVGLTRARLAETLRAGRITPDEAALLVACALQLHAPATLVERFSASGREALTEQLRMVTGRLLEAAMPGAGADKTTPRTP